MGIIFASGLMESYFVLFPEKEKIIMWNPESELLEGAKNLGIKIRQLDVAKSTSIRELIEKKFAMTKVSGRLFERLIVSTGIVNEQAWQWLRDYPESSPVLAFFEKRKSKNIFEFESIKELIDAYYEGGLYTIYLTNHRCDFLLSYTVEQSIVAAGTAKRWLEIRMKQEGVGHCFDDL